MKPAQQLIWGPYSMLQLCHSVEPRSDSLLLVLQLQNSLIGFPICLHFHQVTLSAVIAKMYQKVERDHEDQQFSQCLEEKSKRSLIMQNDKS